MELVNRMRMVILAVVLSAIGVLGPYPENTPAALAAGDVGYRDFSFSANGVRNPTGEKPQSKLWFNDGIWWGSLFNRSTEEYHIYRYDWAAHTWSDTGTLIDERNTSKADALWDGKHLYVVSAGASSTNSSHGARVLRYSYDPATKRYTLDQGFPVTITSGGPEAIVLDKDTTGKLWVTYEWGQQIYVNRTLGDDRTWGTPFVLPVNGANVDSDDISSVVAFDSQIGVMWSNQLDDAMYFATHTDGDPDNVWQGSRAAIQGPKNADDHISLKSLQAADSSGRVFAAVKTSLNDVPNPNPNAPLTLLLVRDRDGNWTNHVFGRVGDDHTRPIMMLDEEHRDLYMFATAPCCAGGTIYYKKTSLNNVSFSDGPGEPFVQSSTDLNINDATSTKQNLSSATGLLVMASSGEVISGSTGSGYYWHNAVSLGTVDSIPPETSIDSGPSGTVNDSSASFAFSSTEPDSAFECALDGASFNGCTSPQEYTGLADGSHTFEVRATDAAGNTDATPASRSWTVDTTAPTISSVTPTDGATSVAVADNVESSFSEAMDASTINGSTFTLVEQGIEASMPLLDDTPIAATVSYDAQAKMAVLNPNEDLEAGATYKATVKGATNGVKDAAGNPLGADKAWFFTTAAAPLADITSPETSIDSGPAGPTNDSTPTFTFSGSDDATASADLLYSHKVDNGEWSAYSGGTSATVGGNTGLPDGPHTFYVKAKDGAGNEDPNPAERSFTVDTRAPESTIDSGPLGTVNSTAASFVFSSSEGGSTFECSLDNAAFAGCGSPKSYSNLPDGSHAFKVRATDTAGNTDATPAGLTWTIDTTAPAVQPPAHGFVGNSTLGTSTVPVKLTWSATDDSGVAGYQLQQSTNGGAYKNVSLPSATATTITHSLAPANTYQFQVRAQDQVGNWSSWTPGPKFRVDAYQESDAAISYVDLWTTQTLQSAYGGALKYAKGLGTEKATFLFTGREVAWVAPLNSNRGQADVYLDGTKVATVDLYSASGKSRTVVFSKAGLDPSVTHTLEVRVLGAKNAASKGKRVDVDAFVVLR